MSSYFAEGKGNRENTRGDSSAGRKWESKTANKLPGDSRTGAQIVRRDGDRRADNDFYRNQELGYKRVQDTERENHMATLGLQGVKSEEKDKWGPIYFRDLWCL
ncbi:Hypothetical protein NTJ_13909 [Nesidiocoris tenuis]|uniref:Uncharacterized protein n=1 Tax=Nesidiocoris tenuis TaxID=355587 RepID=A0ABN7BE21_9HEMI|nr:Hypothetical protein NTJ_13909 [Nesidiocoris tenuis]